MLATIRPGSIFIVAVLALAACGGSEGDAREPTTATAVTAVPLQARCEAFFARARECSEPYIKALVDVRVELDSPPGIAERASADGKDGMYAQAMTEWETDSQPAAVTAMCEQSLASVTPEQSAAMGAGAERCLAETSCEAFSTCSQDMHRMMLAGPPR